jgi:hypothetical protein
MCWKNHAFGAGTTRDETDVQQLPEHVAPTSAAIKKKVRLSALQLVPQLTYAYQMQAAPSIFSLAGGSGGSGSGAGAGAGGPGKDYSLIISAPFNVKHNVHVQVDATAPTGFRGLPADWDTMLSVSGITPAEVAANPQQVLDVLTVSFDRSVTSAPCSLIILQFHMEGPPPKLPKKSELGKLRYCLG